MALTCFLSLLSCLPPCFSWNFPHFGFPHDQFPVMHSGLEYDVIDSSRYRMPSQDAQYPSWWCQFGSLGQDDVWFFQGLSVCLFTVHLFIWNTELHKEEKRPVHWFSPHIAKNGQGRSRTPCAFPTWVAGAPILGPSFIAFPASNAGSDLTHYTVQTL